MRRFGRQRSLALAVALLTAATGALAGCTAMARPTPSQVAATTAMPASPSPSAAPSPAVTPVEAAEVFSTFTVTDDTLRAGGALRLAMFNVRDAEAQITPAVYIYAKNRPPRYTWGSPTLYVPRLAPGGSPPWFMALATRDGRPTLLTFVKGDIWQLGAMTQLLRGQDPPDVERDAEGYATSLRADDKSVTISPQFMGPLHATVAEAGETGVTSGLLAQGPYTTDVAEQIAKEQATFKLRGYSYDSIFSAGDYPVYALRTRGGGALIQYAMTRTTTTTVELEKSTEDLVPVPEWARWLFREPVARRFLKTTEIQQYATLVPKAGTPAPAHIVAHSGSLTKATGGP
ncbi:hypothetical protein [Nonomuraea rhizosphaerae]|uniref:hypothetical protein n=1 Tax=Nonomuraea rhizosphaerae TaxID=2665663 RepID=UPI001C5DE1F1|nr:hypothetical protein [Nonomuraea rhizosphaerae]